MFYLKAHSGRFCLMLVFVCLSMQSLFSIDSSDHESLDVFMNKYNDHGEQYTYLDDGPLDVSAELDSCEKSNESHYRVQPKDSDAHNGDHNGHKSQVDFYRCRGCKPHCCNQSVGNKYFSFYDVGKIIGVIYVAYKTRNIIKTAFVSTIWAVKFLDYSFEWINYCFGVIGG